jgi:serine/threonine protein phosphatase PrpC
VATTNITWACRTRKGRGHAINEDAIGVSGWALSGDGPDLFPFWEAPPVAVSGRDRALFVVADGVGGLLGAQSASLFAAERTSRPDIAASQSSVVDALDATHRELIKTGITQPEIAEMGTTVVGVIVFANGELGCFNVGDSRMYYSSVESLVQATEDDVDDPSSTAHRHRLTAWLGKSDLERVNPKVRRLPADPFRRRVLLCSDGLYRAVGDVRDLERMVLDDRAVGPGDVVEQLFRAAQETDDDATAVVVDVWPANVDSRTLAQPSVVPDGRERGLRGWFKR